MSGRNDAARGRRRNKIKEDFSLTSVPNSEIASLAEKGINFDRLNLSNHFGWRTIGFYRLGEDGYPHVAQFLEKPDVEGGEYRQVTYVLYLEKGASVERDSAFKQTQTGDSHLNIKPQPKQKVTVLDGEEPQIIKEPIDTEDEGDHEPHATQKGKRSKSKKKKIISDFYYVPNRSRSRKREKSKESNEGGDHQIIKLTPDTSKTILPEEDTAEPRKSVEKEVKEEVGKAKKEKKGRGRGKGPDKWQLRAGADHESQTTLKEIQGSKLTKELGTHSSECLLESPSGSNKYLYISKDRGRIRKSNTDN